MKEPLGPNVKRLWSAMVAREAVPPNGSIGSCVAFFIGLSKKDPEALAALKRARENTEAALAAVKAAPDNPYGDDEEAIAAEVMRRVDEKMVSQRKATRP